MVLIEKEARANAMLRKFAKRIVLLLLFTGTRLGEVLNLKWDIIKGDKIILKRTETKQRREKIILMTKGIDNKRA
jgi:integrase